MSEAINLVWKLSVLAELAVAVRLLLQGLGGKYPALLTACCMLPIKSLLLMDTYAGSIPREQARVIARDLEPLEWILCAWIVFELFSWWTRSYKGIGRFGKILLAVLLGCGVVLSLLCWRAEWEALVFAGNLRIYYIMNRVIWATLAIFVGGTWLFFRNYPVAIPPNILRHTYITVTYFVIGALSFLAFTLNGTKAVGVVNLLTVILTLACFSAWAITLTRTGQVQPPLQKVSAEDRERIERLNKELLVFMGESPKTKS